MEVLLEVILEAVLEIIAEPIFYFIRDLYYAGKELLFDC
jgi:hypothetical protein